MISIRVSCKTRWTLVVCLAMYGLLTVIYFESRAATTRTNILSSSLNVFVKNRDRTISDEKGCPKHFLPRKTDYQSDQNTTCKPHLPTLSSCKYVNSFFVYEFDKWNCGYDEKIKICQYVGGSDRTIKCTRSQCISNIIVQTFNDNTGRIEPLSKPFESVDMLEKYIEYHKEHQIKFPFMYLSCEDDPSKSQLFVLDPPVREEANELILDNKPTKSKEININLMFMDSISRAHFYRSLKRTISTFQSLNGRSDSNVEVLDFELFQSIHGHTTENMLGLWTGKIFPKDMTDNQKERESSRFPEMLKWLKMKGYQNLYQEDMCWEGMWGLNADLGAFQDWNQFNEQLKKSSSIDDYGLTFSTCKIIQMYAPETNHIFNTDQNICFNGLDIDAYFLKYLSRKFKMAKEKPLFSYSNLNLAHDPSGKRIQGFDENLSNFVKEIPKLDNTLTIIFADHGNTYNDYVYTELEGRYEQFHPTLFVFVPDKVKKQLGYQVMQNMRQNQKRLINLIDVHHTIKHIADKKHSRRGLLDLIPAERTCGDIEMAMPNLCVCQGWDSPVENTTDLMPFVDFAIGTLNNIISEASPTGRCKKIVPTNFQNILQRKIGEKVTMSFEVTASSGKGSKNFEEKMGFEISYQKTESSDTLSTKLVSKDRISIFGKYRKCSDTDPKFRFCVCDSNPKVSPRKLSQFQDLTPIRTSDVYKLFGPGVIDEVMYFLVPNKLALLVRKTLDPKTSFLISATFEAINLTNDRYIVEVIFQNLSNMKHISDGECKGIVTEHNMRYLCTLIRNWSIYKADFFHDIKFEKVD